MKFSLLSLILFHTGEIVKIEDLVNKDNGKVTNLFLLIIQQFGNIGKINIQIVIYACFYKIIIFILLMLVPKYHFLQQVLLSGRQLRTLSALTLLLQ